MKHLAECEAKSKFIVDIYLKLILMKNGITENYFIKRLPYSTVDYLSIETKELNLKSYELDDFYEKVFYKNNKTINIII